MALLKDMLGTVARWFFTLEQPARSEKDLADPTEESLGGSILRIIEDKNDFYGACLLPLTERDKVILVLLELYTFAKASNSVEMAQEQRQRFLDEVHTAALALLRTRKLVEDAQSFEALAQMCYSRWGAALAKGKEGQSPSGLYRLARQETSCLRFDPMKIPILQSSTGLQTTSPTVWLRGFRVYVPQGGEKPGQGEGR